MKKLILFILMIIPLILYSQNDYESMTNIQKNIVRISVNMKKDTTFFVENLWYTNRMWVRQYKEYNFISFKDSTYQMDLYFNDNELVIAGIYYDSKKTTKPTIEFINKNLYRVYDKCNKYHWIYFNIDARYIINTILDKKNKRIMISLKG